MIEVKVVSMSEMNDLYDVTLIALTLPLPHRCKCCPTECECIVKLCVRLRAEHFTTDDNTLRMLIPRGKQEKCKDHTKHDEDNQEAEKHFKEIAVERPADVSVQSFRWCVTVPFDIWL